MNSIKKTKVFICSSKEQIEYARAVQDNLCSDFQTKIWDQGVFELSEYPLESLSKELDQTSFGIFILAPDDLIILRGDEYSVPRDNVIFELGMVTGKLGRDHTILLAPNENKKFHLPTDLLGLTVATFDTPDNKNEIVAALGPACNKIRRLIYDQSETSSGKLSGISRSAYFSDFQNTFEKLFANATNITLYFIHSRRWREEHNDKIRSFLSRENSSLTVFLPDLANISFIQNIQTHFEDGESIPGLIADAYLYFTALNKAYPDSVTLKFISTYPTYSFYKYDETIIVAMYPTTPIRTSVPTFEICENSDFGEFIMKDFYQLNENCRIPTTEEIYSLIINYTKPTN